MAPEIATHDGGTGDENGAAITDLTDRDVRALTENMSVAEWTPTTRETKGADGMYVVVTESEYIVDLWEGSCTCPDAQYNLSGGQQCKHEARARFDTGDRAIPGGVNREEINYQLGSHVGTPTVVNSDGEKVPADCCWQRD